MRFSHTLFALPFALASMVWAAQGLPSLRTFLHILAAMVTCRNAAMAFDRLEDARFDAENPRTARRHIPAGIFSKDQVAGFDIIYATQDHDVDKRRSLHSLVVRYGVPGALRASRYLHLAMWVTLASLGWLGGLGPVFQASLA